MGNKCDYFSKVDKTIATNKTTLKDNINSIVSKKIDVFKDTDTDRAENSNLCSTLDGGINNWGPYVGTCPHCGSANIEANYGLVLTSYPPQYNCRCKDCKGTFFSGQITYKNELDGTNPSFPNNPSWVPYQPDTTPINGPGHNYGYGNRQGWICPRCGKVNSPDRQFCDCSNNGYYPNIVWCNANNSSGNAPTTPYVTTTNIK